MPTSDNQKCSFCDKYFYRSSKRVNENRKLGWKSFCSLTCLSQSKNKQKEFVCARDGCGKCVTRTLSDIKKCKVVFCSHRCAAIVSNKLHPRNPGIVKICAYCGKDFKSREKYCSTQCQHLGQKIPKSILLDQIKKFVIKNGRIPYKWEIGHYSASRARFGTWNKAIEAAGFKPNPVMFAKKYIANDGDKCDSLAEKIIDDWFYARKIKHKREVPYPGKKGFTADFKVGDDWIEFFGLAGQLKRYDELKKEKLKLAKENNLKITEIYPGDLFPINNLSYIFNNLKQFSS